MSLPSKQDPVNAWPSIVYGDTEATDAVKGLEITMDKENYSYICHPGLLEWLTILDNALSFGVIFLYACINIYIYIYIYIYRVAQKERNTYDC